MRVILHVPKVLGFGMDSPIQIFGGLTVPGARAARIFALLGAALWRRTPSSGAPFPPLVLAYLWCVGFEFGAKEVGSEQLLFHGIVRWL